MKHANSTYPVHQKPIGNPDISLWGDVAHSGMGLHLAWLLDRRKQPQIWGKEWKGKNIFISIHVFNILKTSLLWGVHLSIYFFEVVSLLVDMIGNRNNTQACRKTKQARSTCVVANLLGMQGTENLVWANDLLKGDQDTANMILSMFHQKKKYQWKSKKIQRP